MGNSLHIGIILDGNRRLAKSLMLEPWKGHELGAEKVHKLFLWAKELGVKALTLYTFSMQNFSRPKKEFDYLMGIFKKEFTRILGDPQLMSDRVRMRFIGRTYLLPTDVQDVMKKVEDKTKDNDSYLVNFAIAYGGQTEIVDAAIAFAEEVKAGKMLPSDLDEESFRRYLYIDNAPDLIIRTGGDHRTSNFLNYQSAYSEWFFIDKRWPEFEKSDLVAVIDDYNNRQRRFGK